MSLGSQMSSPPSFHTIPEHVIHESRRERRNSSTSFAAEEGEATPLLAEHNGTEAKGKWFEGPLFVTAIKFSVLFILFTVVVVGTFWFGLPRIERL